MTLGASWPLKTPNTTTGTGFSTRELQYGSVMLQSGSSGQLRLPAAFDDLDGTRPSTLVRVTAARVLQRNEPPTIVPLDDPYAPPRGVITPPDASTVLEAESLVDLTPQLVAHPTQPSEIHWEPHDGDWMLFAFWMRDCEQGVTSFLDGRAAIAATEYLDEHQIGADNVELLHRAGTELFEDSLELNADSVFWTSDMLERFTERHGYNVTPYLPLLFAHGMCRFWVPNEEPMPDFELDTGVGARVRRDYYRLLTDLYISDHLLPLQEWSAGHGLRHKAQLAYGQNLEAIRSNRDFVRAGGRAESESLNAGDRAPISRSDATWRYALDFHRAIVGGAHQGGAVRISTELGAQFQAAYAFTLGDLQQMLAKEWAAGITKPFLHGVATQEPGAAWPTQTRFQHIVSDSWNDTHFPEWANWAPLTDYWARGTVVLETGTPRTDIAIYRDGFLTTAARGVRDLSLDATAPARLADTEALETAGFTVQFVDPIGLTEAGTIGDDGTLFPEGPAYRGLIVDERMITPEAAEAIAEAAERGVRVVIVGEPPSADSGFARGSAGDERVRAAIARALAMPVAVQVEAMADAADAFARLGLVPRVTVDGAALLSQWREAGTSRYVLVYNTLSESAGRGVDVRGSRSGARARAVERAHPRRPARGTGRSHLGPDVDPCARSAGVRTRPGRRARADGRCAQRTPLSNSISKAGACRCSARNRQGRAPSNSTVSAQATGERSSRSGASPERGSTPFGLRCGMNGSRAAPRGLISALSPDPPSYASAAGSSARPMSTTPSSTSATPSRTEPRSKSRFGPRCGTP